MYQGCATCITLGARSSQNSGTKKASGAKLICNNSPKNVWDTTHTYTSHTQIKKNINKYTIRLQCITYTGLETGDAMRPKSVTDMQCTVPPTL